MKKSSQIRIIVSNNVGLIDRMDRIDKSLFRLGWDWIKCALKRNFHFEPVFWFQPVEFPANVR